MTKLPTSPSLVIVGRPNVGKSTLFNRLTGTRRSIVTDEPGITRDRIYGRAVWNGRPFEIVDTGGMLPEDKAAIPREILRQADVAIAGATGLVLVVDARAGVNPLDADLARRLHATGKPLLIAANKVDTAAGEALAAPFYELAKEVYPVSAEHGTGVDDFLDAATRDFPVQAEPPALDSESESAAYQRDTQIAIIGRPNVGKSTLLNSLVGAERSIVSAEPGTTRDAVDTEVERNGRTYRFIDTAGIRRKGKTKLFAEKLSVIMARKHLERADVALLVADAAAGISAGDATIAGYAHESGRSVIVVMNKWDLALIEARRMSAKVKAAAAEAPARRGPQRDAAKRGPHREGPKREGVKRDAARDDAGKTVSADPAKLAAQYEELVRERLKFLNYAPIVFVSALTGDRVDKLYALIDRVAEVRRRRISTGELNRWLASVDLTRGTSPAAHRVKIYYITQASTSPPTFILFTNQRDKLHFSYERFLENRLREEFDFTGAPIRFIQRVRERGRDTRERAIKMKERPRADKTTRERKRRRRRER
jgi:GTP-binding protein